MLKCLKCAIKYDTNSHIHRYTVNHKGFNSPRLHQRTSADISLLPRFIGAIFFVYGLFINTDSLSF